MQEKESVNFFYYLNPKKIQKYQKQQVLNNKNRQLTRAKKTKVIKFVKTILVEVKNLPKKLKTDLSAFIAYFG